MYRDYVCTEDNNDKQIAVFTQYTDNDATILTRKSFKVSKVTWKVTDPDTDLPELSDVYIEPDFAYKDSRIRVYTEQNGSVRIQVQNKPSGGNAKAKSASASAKGKHIYNGKSYVIKTGPRGGQYITVNGKKKYVKSKK